MLTASDLAIWSALYAAAWFETPTMPVCGTVSDAARALIAATHADRALAALRQVRPEVVE